MRLSVRLGASEKAEVLRILQRKVASNLYITETSGTRASGEYHVGASVTEILDDAKALQRTVRYVKLDDVASYKYRLSRTRLLLEGPSRRGVAQRANAHYRRIVHRSQDLLLPSLYGRLVRIPDVRLAMSPLRTILLMLNQENGVRPSMFVSARKGAAKVKNYFTLLSDLRVVQLEDGNYVPGPFMRKLSVEASEEELYSRILASALEKRFEYIREVLKWTMMVPFLEWSNAYYFPAYEAGSLLRLRDDDYFGHYYRLYRRPRNKAEVLAQATKVKDAGVLLRDETFWTGDEEIFDEFSKQSDQHQLLPSSAN